MARGKYREKRERKEFNKNEMHQLKNNMLANDINQKKIKTNKIKSVLLSKKINFFNLILCFLIFIIILFKKTTHIIKAMASYDGFLDIVDNFFKDRFKIKSKLIAICIFILPLIFFGGVFTDFLIFSSYLSGISKEIIDSSLENLLIPHDILSYAWYYIRVTENIMSNLIFPQIFHKNSNHYILNAIFLFFSYYICYYLDCLFKRKDFFYLGKKRSKILFFLIFFIIYSIIIYIIPVVLQSAQLMASIYINVDYITSLFAMHFYFIFLYFLYNVLEKSFKEIAFFILFFIVIYSLNLENLWFNIYNKETMWGIILILNKVLIMSAVCVLIRKIGKEKGYILLFLIQGFLLGLNSSPFTYITLFYIILFLLGGVHCLDVLRPSLVQVFLFLKKNRKDTTNKNLKRNCFWEKRNLGKIKKITAYVSNFVFVFPLIFIMLTTYSGVNKIFNEPSIRIMNRNYKIVNSENAKPIKNDQIKPKD